MTLRGSLKVRHIAASDGPMLFARWAVFQLSSLDFERKSLDISADFFLVSRS